MLLNHMEAVENRILASSEISKNSGHPLHKGTPREAFIKEFLEAHLPSTVAIGTGEIIDYMSIPGELRNQYDIIIYRKEYPKLDLGGGVNAFLVESVIATIEVKSTLDQGGIEQAVKAAVNAKKLKPNLMKFVQFGYELPSIINYVVAYSGPTNITTVHNWIKNVHSKLRIDENPTHFPERLRNHIPAASIDGVFVLKNGFIHFDNIPETLTPHDLRAKHPGNGWAAAKSKTGTLLYLFYLLTNICVHSAAFALDGVKYLEKVPRTDFKLLP